MPNKSDFDILIAILKERNAVMQKNRNCVLMILALLKTLKKKQTKKLLAKKQV